MDTTDPTALVPESEVAEFCMDHSGGIGGPSSFSKNSINSTSFLGSDISFLTTSALTGENIDEAFRLLAGMVLTKIEMGVIDPENMDSGVQYGDVPRWDRNSTRRGGNMAFSGKSSKKHGRSLTTLVAGSGHLGAGGNEYQSRLQRNKIVLGGSSSSQSIALEGAKSTPSSPLASSLSSSNSLYNRCC